MEWIVTNNLHKIGRKMVTGCSFLLWNNSYHYPVAHTMTTFKHSTENILTLYIPYIMFNTVYWKPTFVRYVVYIKIMHLHVLASICAIIWESHQWMPKHIGEKCNETYLFCLVFLLPGFSVVTWNCYSPGIDKCSVYRNRNIITQN
jgi:hypothetical protein